MTFEYHIAVSPEYREAAGRIVALGESGRRTEADLLALLDEAPGFISTYSNASRVEHRGETIIWYEYEWLLWKLGEAFRQILKRQKSLRRSESLWERIEAVCLDARYGKGRESFTMLLGQYGGVPRVPVLLVLLEDPDMSGHALYAMRLLGAPDAIEQATRMLNTSRAWVRREARKYLAKVAVKEPPPPN